MRPAEVSIRSARPAADLQKDRASQGCGLRLKSALDSFRGWLLPQGIDLEKLLENVPHLSKLLAAFAQASYNRRGTELVARCPILGIQDIRRDLKVSLRLAWDSVFTWHFLDGTKSRIPLRIEPLELIASFAGVTALEAETRLCLQWLGFSVLLRVSFHALLRPAELFALSVSNVKLPGPGVFESVRFGL